MARTVKDYSVPALEKSILILNALAERRSMNITEIHTQLNIPKSTTFVILNALERHSFITKSEDGRYQLGYAVFQLGMSFYRDIDVRQVARPFLQELVQDTPFTGHLAVLFNEKAVYVDKVEGGGFVRFATTIGQNMPLHLSGVGKALMSGLSDQAIRELYAVNMERLTEKSLGNVDDLLEEIRFVREYGYVIEDEQMEQGIRCIGAPIFGHTGDVIASISVTALSRDLPVVKFQPIGERVRDTAQQISKRISYGAENEALAADNARS